MTKEQLEDYIARLLPELRKRCVYTADDDNDCQLALIDLLRKVDKLTVSTDEEFTNLLLSYYNRLRYRRRCLNYRDSRVEAAAIRRREAVDSKQNGNYLDAKYQRHFVDESTLTDPWNNNTVNALEYLQLIDNPKVKAMMFDYYIAGYTLGEIGAKHSISGVMVHKLLKQGIEWIKEGLSL